MKKLFIIVLLIGSTALQSMNKAAQDLRAQVLQELPNVLEEKKAALAAILDDTNRVTPKHVVDKLQKDIQNIEKIIDDPIKHATLLNRRIAAKKSSCTHAKKRALQSIQAEEPTSVEPEIPAKRVHESSPQSFEDKDWGRNILIPYNIRSKKLILVQKWTAGFIYIMDVDASEEELKKSQETIENRIKNTLGSL